MCEANCNSEFVEGRNGVVMKFATVGLLIYCEVAPCRLANPEESAECVRP